MKLSYWRTGIITTATLIATAFIILISRLSDSNSKSNFLDGLI